jgi:hypothetical protein
VWLFVPVFCFATIFAFLMDFCKNIRQFMVSEGRGALYMEETEGEEALWKGVLLIEGGR